MYLHSGSYNFTCTYVIAQFEGSPCWAGKRRVDGLFPWAGKRRVGGLFPWAGKRRVGGLLPSSSEYFREVGCL